MNNERYNQIIDEVYKNYKIRTHKNNEKNGNWGEYSKWGDNPLIASVQHLTKSSFIQMVKTDPEFSERWGLKIEERKLDMMERWQLAGLTPNMTEFDYCNKLCDEHKVPTKLITLTYKDEKIEIYEN